LKNNPVINKYAMALFNVAFDRDVADDVLKGMAVIRRAFDTVPVFTGFMTNPNISHDKKETVIAGLLEDNNGSSLVSDFVALVFKKGRVESLPEMAEAYEDLIKTARGELDVRVFTPFPLNEEQKKSIADKISSIKNNQKISVSEQIEKGLIGGIRIELEGKTYDGSVAGSLSKIEKMLKGE